jgi:hypothetical protein
MRDDPTRTALAALQGMIDTDAATAAWEAALGLGPNDGLVCTSVVAVKHR